MKTNQNAPAKSDPVTTSNGKKLYLATFELVSGEYGQPFAKAFYAKDEKSLEQEIHKYLLAYYGDGNVSEVKNDIYYYFNGEVTVKDYGWQRITSFKQLVNKLT